MNILGLYQGSGYVLEFPVTVDGAVLASADAIRFDIYRAGSSIYSDTSCAGGGMSLSGGLISVPLSSSDTVNFSGPYYTYELWFITSGGGEKHIITTGSIEFQKTLTRITPCL